MSKKVTILTIPGNNPKRFADVICGYVKTQKEESVGIVSDYVGTIDEENQAFNIARKSRGTSKVSYEASLTGTYKPSADGKSLVVEYYTSASPLFYVCFAIISLIFAGALAFTLIQYFSDADKVRYSFTLAFGFAFLILLPNAIFRFDVQALHRLIGKIANEYAVVVEKEGKTDD